MLKLNGVRERAAAFFAIFAGWVHMSEHFNGVNWIEVDKRTHR